MTIGGFIQGQQAPHEFTGADLAACRTARDAEAEVSYNQDGESFAEGTYKVGIAGTGYAASALSTIGFAVFGTHLVNDFENGASVGDIVRLRADDDTDNYIQCTISSITNEGGYIAVRCVSGSKSIGGSGPTLNDTVKVAVMTEGEGGPDWLAHYDANPEEAITLTPDTIDDDNPVTRQARDKGAWKDLTSYVPPAANGESSAAVLAGALIGKTEPDKIQIGSTTALRVYVGTSLIYGMTVSAAAAFAGGTEALAAPVSHYSLEISVTAAFAGGTEAVAATVSTTNVEAPAVPDAQVAAAFTGGTEALAGALSTTSVGIPVTAALTGGAEALAAAVSTSAVNAQVAAAFTGGTEAVAATLSTIEARIPVAAAFAGGTEAVTTSVTAFQIYLPVAAAFAGGTEAVAATVTTVLVDKDVAAAFAGGTEAVAASVTSEQPPQTPRYLAFSADLAVTDAEAKAGESNSDGTDTITFDGWTGTVYLAFCRPASEGSFSELYLHPTATPTANNQIGGWYEFPDNLTIDSVEYKVLISLSKQTYQSSAGNMTIRVV